MRALGVIECEPLIEIVLQVGDRLESLCTKDDAEELIEDGAVESLDEPVCLRSSNAARPVLDVVEFKIDLVRVEVSPLELGPVVRKNVLDSDPEFAVERQNVIVDRGDGRFRFLVRVREPECMA